MLTQWAVWRALPRSLLAQARHKSASRPKADWALCRCLGITGWPGKPRATVSSKDVSGLKMVTTIKTRTGGHGMVIDMMSAVPM